LPLWLPDGNLFLLNFNLNLKEEPDMKMTHNNRRNPCPLRPIDVGTGRLKLSDLYDTQKGETMRSLKTTMAAGARAERKLPRRCGRFWGGAERWSGLLFALIFVGSVTVPVSVRAQIGTTDLNTVTCTDIINTLLGGGISVSNVTCTGANVALGAFTGGTGIISPDSFSGGAILSSGDIANVIGPNTADDITTVNGQPGDSDLDTLIPGFSTFDAAVLEFDFVPAGDTVAFQYVFVSEEYNEYTNSLYNDVFGFFVNGVNRALLPDGTTTVSINNVNGGHPDECSNGVDDDSDGLTDGDDPDCTTSGDNIVGENHSNSQFFTNNDCSDPDGLTPCPINIQADGLIKVLTLTAPVNAGQVNHMKLAIADAGDDALDAWVFIEAGSLTVPLDHFQCYKAKPTKGSPKFEPRTVSLTDQFETGSFDVTKPINLCNPADKNDEGLNDPVAHLEGYVIKGPKHVRHNVKVENQLGELLLTTAKADRLLAPTAKSLTAPVEPLETTNVDHFKCYKVKSIKGDFCTDDSHLNPGGACEVEEDCGGVEDETSFCLPNKFPKGLQVTVGDQFTDPPKVFDVKKPSRLCNPVDKEGEGIQHPDAHLMCYQVKPAKEQPKHEGRSGVFVHTQFGPEQLDTVKEEMLCVPSEKEDLSGPPALE
jgi:hypothetical protein